MCIGSNGRHVIIPNLVTPRHTQPIATPHHTTLHHPPTPHPTPPLAPSLVSITVPCLASLVFKAPSPLAAAAASLLAEGLASPAAAHHWRQHLGDLPAFLSR